MNEVAPHDALVSMGLESHENAKKTVCTCLIRVPDEKMLAAVIPMLADDHDLFVKHSPLHFAPGTAIFP